jgi:hypothetical protein
LGVGGELKEHLLQTRAVGGTELDQGDPGLVRDAADRLGIGLDAQGAAAGAGAGGREGNSGGGQRRGELIGLQRPDVSACGRQQVVLGALGDDAAVADDDQVVRDDLDLVQQVRGQQDGCAEVGAGPQQSLIQRMPAGSSPFAGSSRMRTSGSPRRAAAIPSRCRIPRE